MKKNRMIVLIVSIIIMVVIWGLIAYTKGTEIFHGLDLFIFILIVVFGVIAFIIAQKKLSEQKKGIPADDELSTQIKYKSGYYAYMASMYMWLFIFIMKDKFPNTESMIGGGILLSALIFAIARYIIKKKFTV